MATVLLDEKGLAPAICQNIETGEVLMLGYVSPGALKRTLEGGEVWFYSRSRSDLWHKGEVSGNYMRIRSASVDCDGDVILLKVVPDGPICHTGNPTCFFTPLRRSPRLRGSRKRPGHPGGNLLRNPGPQRVNAGRQLYDQPSERRPRAHSAEGHRGGGRSGDSRSEAER